LLLYRSLSYFFHFIAPLYLHIRKHKGKEDPMRLPEKLGRYKTIFEQDNKIIIHIHGASVGETLSALPIIEALSDDFHNLFFIITSHTLSSATIMKKKLPENAAHFFAPLDTPQATRHFYRQFKPHLSLILDSEIWPNLAYTAQLFKTPLYGVNTRLSEKSMRLWRKIPNFTQKILRAYHGFFVQNKNIAAFIQEHFTGPISVIPNLKWAAHVQSLDIEKIKKTETQTNQRFIVCLLSTHKNEEYDITQNLYQHGFFENAKNLLLIVPRHPERKDDILNALQQVNENFHIASRSQHINIEYNTQIYIADTLGETYLWCQLSNIVFIGNSLTQEKKGGGHNPIEAASCGKAIITGNKIQNFTEIFNILENSNACIVVQSASELTDKIFALYHKPESIADLQSNSRAVYLNEHNHALDFLIPIKQKISEIDTFYAKP